MLFATQQNKKHGKGKHVPKKKKKKGENKICPEIALTKQKDFVQLSPSGVLLYLKYIYEQRE